MDITQKNSLKGEITIPGDKSISHRAVMFGSLASGLTEVGNFLKGNDCLSTIECFRKLGIEIEDTGNRILIHGKGLHGLSTPSTTLDAGNSGTTARLITGILSAQCFETTITGDASIQTRPMNRIMEPLSQMGARIKSLKGNGCAPLKITGAPLQGIHYTTKVASAQIKSSILLAGLYAASPTTVTEPAVSRDHTEIMLRYFGADIRCENSSALILPEPDLRGQKVFVPGDISSAAYFIAAGLIIPGSEILIRCTGINPTRSGILKVAQQMGGNISYLNTDFDNGEPTADILVRSSDLKGITIGGEIIPTLIDEIPIIAVMAAYASGTTVIKDAAELKVKESNRIEAMVKNLSAMGVRITATEDGMIIEGCSSVHGAAIDTCMDHRIAMSLAVAGLNASGVTKIPDDNCISISYPGFYKDLKSLF